MAVVGIDTVEDGQDGQEDHRRKRDFTRKYRVWCDEATDGPLLIQLAFSFGLAAGYVEGSLSDSGSLIETIHSVREGEGTTVYTGTPDGTLSPTECWRWITTVKYASEFRQPEKGQSPTSNPQDPTARNPVWKFGWEVKQRAIVADLDNKTFKTSAEMPYDPPVQVDWPFFKIDITKNYLASSLPDDFFSTRFNTTNSTFWPNPSTGPFIDGELLMTVDSGETQYEHNIAFYAIHYSILGHPDSDWHLKLLDQGFYELVDNPTGGGKSPALIRDIWGTPISQPHLLDGHGNKLPSGGTPVFNKFRIYDSRSYSDVP